MPVCLNLDGEDKKSRPNSKFSRFASKQRAGFDCDIIFVLARTIQHLLHYLMVWIIFNWWDSKLNAKPDNDDEDDEDAAAGGGGCGWHQRQHRKPHGGELIYVSSAILFQQAVCPV